jgi:hypothetical protein
MDKLSTIGSKINAAVKYSRENWKQLIKINGNVPSILLLYGKFLVQVLNEKGTDLIKKSKRLALKQLEKKKGGLGDIDNANDPLPMIIVGSNKGEQGYIKKSNLLFSSLFGHYKDEIIDKKINIIMPHIYANNHDRFFNSFLECKD